MNVMVTGSRGWTDHLTVLRRLAALSVTDDELLHGGADGADTIASLYWIGRQTAYRPNYEKPSPQRYHERNDAMLDRADLVLAFWDGSSRGTASVIRKARKRGIPVEVFDLRPEGDA